jgi:hypothetical protein
MTGDESYRGFVISLEEQPIGQEWHAVISSGDPMLTELIADGGTATVSGTDRQHARLQARQFIDTLLEPHAEHIERFRIGQTWIGDGSEGEVVETRLDGLEARLRIDGKISDWLALDPRDGVWNLKPTV